MIAWVETFDLIWFTYSNLPEAKPGTTDITMNGTLLTYQKTLQTTTTIQDIGQPRFMCYSAGFNFVSNPGVPKWTARVYVHNPQEDPEVNRRAALDGLKQFLLEQSTHQKELYADRYLATSKVSLLSLVTHAQYLPTHVYRARRIHTRRELHSPTAWRSLLDVY